MGKKLVRMETPARRKRGWLVPGNTMSFPRELRDAIPDLPTCMGRVLQLDSTTGLAGKTRLLGPRVQLKIVVKETGKLKGEFVVRMDLRPEAARGLAETLARLADEAENSR